MHGRNRLLWLLAALVLAAFALRMINLERQPLHFDEGINVTFGSHSPFETLSISQTTFDNDPPGHRLPLITWMALAGPSPFSIRFFSVIFGLLMIPLTYRLLRALRLRAEVSMLAALLVALSAFAIDYSQEAKGYALGAAMATLSWWMWVTLSGKRASQRWLRIVVYIASAALSIATHYYTVFLLPMQWVWWLGARVMPYLTGGADKTAPDRAISAPSIRYIPGFWKEALGRLAAQVVACVPLLIWVALMFSTLQVSSVRASSYRVPVSPFTLLARIFTEMSVTRYADELISTVGASALVLAVGVGAIRLWRARGEDRRNGFWFGMAIIVPISAALVLQQRVTFFYPRFFMYVLPSLCLLVAASIMPVVSRRISSLLRLAPFVVALLLLSVGNVIFHTAPLDNATDYREMVSMLRPYIHTGDLATTDYIWMEGFFKSYAPETGESLTWRSDLYSADAGQVKMAQAAQNHPRVWLMLYKHSPDANDVAALTWLRQNAARAAQFAYNEASAQLFDLRAQANVGAAKTVILSDTAQLDFQSITVQVRRGDTLPFTLRWTALRKWDEYATIFVHLIDADGRLVAQSDGDAANGQAPNFTWQPGQPVIDHRAVLITIDLPPGQYELRVGMYLKDGGARLSAGDLDYVPIGTLRVLP